METLVDVILFYDKNGSFSDKVFGSSSKLAPEKGDTKADSAGS